MVMLAAKDKEDFPKLFWYLQVFFFVYNNKKVWSSFLKWSSLDERSAFKCLLYGTDPIIKVNPNLNSALSHGHFSPSKPNEIWIERDKTQIFNKSKDQNRVFETGKYLESLILHELVHWGRHRTGTLDEYYENNMDSGDKFQTEAYTNVDAPHFG